MFLFFKGYWIVWFLQCMLSMILQQEIGKCIIGFYFGFEVIIKIMLYYKKYLTYLILFDENNILLSIVLSYKKLNKMGLQAPFSKDKNYWCNNWKLKNQQALTSTNRHNTMYTCARQVYRHWTQSKLSLDCNGPGLGMMCWWWSVPVLSPMQIKKNEAWKRDKKPTQN